MSSKQPAISGSVSQLLFQLEGAVLLLRKSPLVSLQQVISVLDQLSVLLQREEPASFYVNQLFHLIERKHRRRSFFIPEVDQHLLVWISCFRSLYLFKSFAMEADWSQLTPMYAKLIEVAQGDGGKRYIGQFDGRPSDCFQDLEMLSELGFWSMKECSNDSFVTGTDERFCVSVTLISPVPLTDLSHMFCHWHWHLEQSAKGIDPLPSYRSEALFGLSDIVHILASEREVWRHNEALTSLYSLLHRKMLNKSALALDVLLPRSRKTGLMLVAQELDISLLETDSQSTPILSYGQVYLHSQYKSRRQRVPLAGSSIPIYRVTLNDQEIVIPAFRISFDGGDESVLGRLDCVEGHWRLFQKSEQALSNQQQLYLHVQDTTYLLAADHVARDYGVVLRAHYLPNDVINIWSVRDQFFIEPRLFEELDRQDDKDLSSSDWLSSSVDTRNLQCLGIKLDSQRSIVVSHDWVESIQPWRSVVLLQGGFVSHFGSVTPLIQVCPSSCANDVVLFIKVDEYQFALRAAGVINQPQHESLEKLEDIVLDWQDGCLHLLPVNGGCTLFNEYSALALHKRLLEIFK